MHFWWWTHFHGFGGDTACLHGIEAALIARGGKRAFLPLPTRGVGGVLQDPNPEKKIDEKAVGKKQKAVGKPFLI